MYESKIYVNYDKELETVFSLEDKDFGNNRASYSFERDGDKLIILIRATDSVALRAVFNTVTKILTVYEKASRVVEKYG